MNDYLSGFDDWQSAFADWSDVSISELHGMMTAVVCVCHAPKQDEWARFLSELSFDVPNEEALALLTEYGEDVAHSLGDKEEAYEYLPLLPDDEHDLHERLRALKDWAGGFISGLGMVDMSLQDDEREMITDLSKIAAIRVNEQMQATEEHYLHLYEFVRMVPVALAVHNKKPIMSLALIKGLAADRKTAHEMNNTTDATHKTQSSSSLPPIVDAMNGYIN